MRCHWAAEKNLHDCPVEAWVTNSRNWANPPKSQPSTYIKPDRPKCVAVSRQLQEVV